MHKQQGWAQAWEYCQAKLIQILGRVSQGVNWSWSQCIKSHYAQTSSGKGLPSYFWNRNNVSSILPGLRRKKNWTIAQWSKDLFSDKSKFCISFGNRGLEEDWRGSDSMSKSSVKFSKSEMIWGTIMSAGFGLSSPKSMKPSTRRFFKYIMLPSADKLYGDADFLFQQDFSTYPQCQNHFQVVCWPWYYCAWLASQHAWPEPHLESMGNFQEKDEKQSIQQYRWAEGSIVPQQCHRLIASMPHLTDAVICAKQAPTKYWVHKWIYFKKLEVFRFDNSYFDWS